METIHHQKTKEAFLGRHEWWEQETISFRCPKCWLRHFQCYCNYMTERKYHYDTLFGQNKTFKLEVYMYYHHLEIGRSANTAHIFDVLGESVVIPIVYGDENAEARLMETIVSEYKQGITNTCILYPNNESLLLSDWINNTVIQSFPTQETSEPSSNNLILPPIRIILLDGTYPCASRMAKALLNMREAYLLPEEVLPFVKLDLSENGLKSAVAGIMYQPAKFKICSYQAIVLAIQQIYETFHLPCSILVTDLLQDLDNWLAYIVKAKIKLTKTKPVTGIEDVVDQTPANFIQEIVKNLTVHPNNLKPNSSKQIKSTDDNQAVPAIRRRRRKRKKTIPTVVLVSTRKFRVFSIVYI